MEFNIKKVCHPCNIEEAKKYEGKKGWFADSVETLERIVKARDSNRFGKMKLPNSCLELPYRMLNDYNVLFRYFYPAPEPEYRPFTGEEKAEDMTLRDYFAGQVAPGIIQGLMMRYKENGYSDESAIYEATRLSMMYADAMMLRREE